MSHDLRTPLASIKAAVSSLRADDVLWEPDDERALLETVADETDRLQRLIDNLLDLSRLQTGAVHPPVAPSRSTRWCCARSRGAVVPAAGRRHERFRW